MKKGFTLIELLAVIVILAIIALIATPIVLNIIDDANKSSLMRNVENIKSSAELYVSKSYLRNEVKTGNIYNKVIEMVKGKEPDSGIIYANSKGELAFSFKYNEYCYTKGYEDKEIKVEKTNTCIVPIDYLMVQEQTSSEDAVVFNSSIPRKNIEKVYTVATNKVSSEVIDSFDVSEAQNGSIMAWYKDEDENGLYELYKGQDGGVKANPDSSKLFNYFINMIEIDLSNLDISNVTNMRGIFNYCKNLTNLDLSSFNTSNVTDMSGMFNHCEKLTNLDLSGFNTSSVTTMQGMFQRCQSLISLDLSNFNTSNVTTMRTMFNECRNLTSLNINDFDTSNVTTMRQMFQNCLRLKSLNLSNFDTTKVDDMSYMFTGCTNIDNLILKNFITSNVTTMRSMFAGMSNLKILDISTFNTSNVTNMMYMFGSLKFQEGIIYNCSSLENLDLSNFDTSNVTETNGMFKGTSSLKNLKLNKASFNKVTTYAEMFDNTAVTNITVKDATAKTFIEARLADAGKIATVTVGQ